jgi:hypothetical protein
MIHIDVVKKGANSVVRKHLAVKHVYGRVNRSLST